MAFGIFENNILCFIVISVVFYVCTAVASPLDDEDAIENVLTEAVKEIKCLKEELHRYQIDKTYCGKANRRTKIVGGQTTEVNEYPWQAALVKRGSTEVKCGGSLINSQWILTAAHCTHSKDPKELQVILGNHAQDNVEGSELRSDIRVIKVHPNYNNSNWDNDISLLEILSPLSLNKLMPAIMPVCLPRSGNPSQYDNVPSIVTGWGATSSGGPISNTLQEATVNTMDNTQCGQLYNGKILGSMICAAALNRDTCQGDSGGPLITEVCGSYYLIGITSWGKGCAEEGYPGVYARVTNALDWITQTTSSNANNKCMSCPTYFFRLGEQCFRYFSSRSTYEEAKDSCATVGALLAKPHDPVALRAYIVTSYGTDTYPYIGARGVGGSVAWDRDGVTIPASLPTWCCGNPGSLTRSSDCLVLMTSAGWMKSDPNSPYYMLTCTNARPFICEFIRE